MDKKDMVNVNLDEGLSPVEQLEELFKTLDIEKYVLVSDKANMHLWLYLDDKHENKIVGKRWNSLINNIPLITNNIYAVDKRTIDGGLKVMYTSDINDSLDDMLSNPDGLNEIIYYNV